MSKGQFFALAAWHIEGRDAVAIDSVGVKSKTLKKDGLTIITGYHYYVTWFLLCCSRQVSIDAANAAQCYAKFEIIATRDHDLRTPVTPLPHAPVFISSHHMCFLIIFLSVPWQ